jgi:nitrogen fixation-related uncharacterized protein
MHPYILGLIAMGVLFGCTCLGAMFWAAKTGQFGEIEQGARCIFTPDEPAGAGPDRFPAKPAPRRRA